MDFAELSQMLLNGLVPGLETHVGAALFARERCKLDSWLSLEVYRVMVQAGLSPECEREMMDVACGRWGLLVRSLVTNIPCDHAKEKKRPIKKAIDAIIKDIWMLTNPGVTSFTGRAILFAAYPTTHDDERWQSLHLRQIATELNKLEHRSFNFWGNIPGVLYLGLCSEH